MTEQDMVDGYLDAGDPDAPVPGSNRSESYRHGFANRRDDKAQQPRAPFAVIRALADAILEKEPD